MKIHFCLQLIRSFSSPNAEQNVHFLSVRIYLPWHTFFPVAEEHFLLLRFSS